MIAPESSGRPDGVDPGDPDSETLRRAIALIRIIRDPALPGLLFFSWIVAGGVVALLITVLATADDAYVALQVPYVVSGGLAGVALIAVGTVLTAVQSDRRDRALARHELQQLVDGVSALVRGAVGSRRGKDW